MTEFRARHTEVFDLLASRMGMATRTLERIAERIRTRYPQGWPSVTPGRARGGDKREVDSVHLTYLVIGAAGAPAISDAADACTAFMPMLAEGAGEFDLGVGNCVRFPGVPDPLEWPLARFVHHLIANRVDTADLTLCRSAPIAQLTIRATKADQIFGPPPRPDGLQWWPRFMGPMVLDRETAVRVLCTVPGPLLAKLGELLRPAEDAPPVRQRAADRLDDLRPAA